MLEPSVCKLARDYGHLVIFGCPNNPQDQMAEFLNAHVKAMVRKRAKKK